MDFQSDHESSLRSFIQQRARDFQTGVETIAQRRDNAMVNSLEEQVDREAVQFIADVQNQLDSMRNDIKSRRPTNANDPDFVTRMAQYQQFVSGASTGVQRVTAWVNLIFEKIIAVVRKVVQWIIDQAKTIITVLETIRDSFNELIDFFFRT